MASLRVLRIPPLPSLTVATGPHLLGDANKFPEDRGRVLFCHATRVPPQKNTMLDLGEHFVAIDLPSIDVRSYYILDVITRYMLSTFNITWNMLSTLSRSSCSIRTLDDCMNPVK